MRRRGRTSGVGEGEEEKENEDFVFLTSKSNSICEFTERNADKKILKLLSTIKFIVRHHILFYQRNETVFRG